MATGLSYIVDGSDAFELSGNVSADWQNVSWDLLYKKTGWYPQHLKSFLFSFEGTSVAFTGGFQGNGTTAASVQIDNGTAFSINGNPTSYRQWFQSPTLPDGPHAINVTLMQTIILDFAVVSAGNQTQLAGRDVIVDNDSPSIVYSGHWNRNTSVFQALLPYTIPVYPYGNSMHQSSTPGDSFTFRFTGTSVAVYGVSSWLKEGTLAATYTIDGVTIAYRTYNITASFFVGEGPGDVPNFSYYSLDDLPAGDHTLTVNITLANHLAFTLDYITYKPSFQTLSSMPLINNTPSTTPTLFTTLLNPSSTPQTSQVRTSDSPKSSSTPAIVGGVIGVLGLVVILATWFLLERKKANRSENISPYSRQPTDEDTYYHRDDTNDPCTTNHNGNGNMPQLQPQPAKYRRLNQAVQEPDPHLPLSSYPPPNIDNTPSLNPPHYSIIAI